jgi:ABC-2 type transport system permease protein
VFRGLGGIVYKEILQVMRDPASLMIMIVLPVVQLMIYGYAIDTEVKNVYTVVFDQDRSPASRDFVDRLRATGLYTIVDNVASSQEMYEAIVADRAKVGINIPPDYQRKLASGKTASIQVLIDGSNNTVAGQTLSTVQNLGLAISAQMLGVNINGGLPVEVRPRLLFNPSQRSSNFFVPGLVGILLFILTMQLTAFAIVREREVGTLEQLMVTPVTRWALMVGKVVPYIGMGMIQMLVILLFAQLLFNVHIAGNLFLLMGLALLFIFSSLGIGLIISTIAKTQLQAMLMSFMMMLPSILLSGFIFPRESMPKVVYYISALLPVTYFIRILRGVILRGAGFDALWDEALVLLVMGIVLLSIAALRFRKTLIA